MFSSGLRVIEQTKKRLFSPAQKEKIKRRSLMQAGVTETFENENEPDKTLKTILRIRPAISNTENDDLITVDSPTSVLVKPEGKNRVDKYSFTKVLDDRSSQEIAFNESCTGLIEGVLSDRNSCLFTYGASGSGKTYTIMGGPGEKAGIIPRAMESIFNSLSQNIYTKTDIRPSGSAYISRVGLAEERRWNKIKTNLINQNSEPISGDWNKHEKQNRRRSSFLSPIEVLQGNVPDPVSLSDYVKNTDYIVYGSFIEIYNEKIFDLLVPPSKTGKRDDLRIRQDAKGPFVGNALEIQINTAQEAYKLLDVGRKNLIVAQTKLNQESSRSHCLFILKIARKVTESRWSVSNLCFCDLAGCERSKKIGNNTTRLDELKTINRSLMQLGIVIEELRNNQAKPGSVAVSFRNSKLTRLMQSYLTGNSQTTIVVAVSQNPDLNEETINSLKFAASAQTVQTLGIDRHGRALMSSTKLNMTSLLNDQSAALKSMGATMIEAHRTDSFYRNSTMSSMHIQSKINTRDARDSCPLSSLEEEQNYIESYNTANQSSHNHESDEAKFMKWRKKELIDDLIYYKDADKAMRKTLLDMKDAWKQDEAEKIHYQSELNSEKINNLQRISDLRKSLHNDHEAAMCELLDKLDIKSKKLKKLENEMCSLEELDELRESKKSYNRLMQSHESIIKENNRLAIENEEVKSSRDTLDTKLEINENRLRDQTSQIKRLEDLIRMNKLDKANKDNKILDLEQEIIQLQNRNDELLRNGDISIDFNSIGPPKSRSSIMPSTPSPRPGNSAPEYRTPGPCMNSTVDMMSDFSRSRDELRTPDISILKEDPTEKNSSDDVIDLYRQILDLNSTIRQKEKEITDMKKDLEEKASEISILKNGSPALKHQIESAAQREAELDQRITQLESENSALKVDKESLEKQVDRSILKKKNARLQSDNEQLLEKIADLESQAVNSFRKLSQKTAESLESGSEKVSRQMSKISIKTGPSKNEPTAFDANEPKETGRQLRSRKL